MSFSSEEIAKIHVVINSGDIPDFSEKMRDAGKSVSQLQEEIQQTQKDLGILAARGDQNTDNFKVMQNHLSKLQTQLKNTNKEMKYYTENIDINLMSSNQLNARSKVLANTLNALSKEAEPDRWNELNDELIKVRRRMDEVRVGTLGVSDSMDITGMSMQQLDVYSRQLKARLAAVPRDAANSKEWDYLHKRLKAVESEQKKVSSSMSSEFSGIFKKIGWGTLFSGVLSALKKFGQDFVSNSNVIGDRWNRTMTGMRKGYEAFLTTLASGDWSNFFSNVARAYREGRELAEMQEALFEMQNASSLTETRNNIEISRQTAIMRDTTRSNEERIAAANEILRLEREIMDTKERTAERARDAALKEIRIKTKGNLIEEDMVYMVDNYFQNEEMINAAGDYLKLDEELKDLQKLTRRAAYRDSQGFAAGVDRKIEELEKEMKAMLTDTDGLERAVEFQREYDLLNDEQIQNYVNAQTSYLKAQADFEQSTLRAKTTLSKLKEELKTEEYEKDAAAVEEWAVQERIAVKQRAVERQITEKEMNDELERIETERLHRVNEVNKHFGMDMLDSVEHILDNELSVLNSFTKAAVECSSEAFDEALSKSREVNAELDRMFADILSADMAEIQSSLDDDAERTGTKVQKAGDIKRRFSDNSTKLTLLATDRDVELSELQSLYDDGLIKEEEFQRARNDIIRRYAQEAAGIQTSGWEDGLQTASGILNNLSSMVSSIQQAESAALEAKMQKELAVAGANAEKKAQIEEKYEAQQLALKKKYADVDMVIQIGQALASGALAMVQAWNAAAGNPVLAGIIMGLIGATTSAQVATIIAQRNAIKNATPDSASSSGTSVSVREVIHDSYSEGGFTGYGGRMEPAGIVHRGEYVVPQPQMRDPEAFSHVLAIERIRRRHNVKNSLPGYADGGYVSGDRGTDEVMRKLIALIEDMRTTPVKAYVSYTDLQAKKDLHDRFNSRASL